VRFLADMGVAQSVVEKLRAGGHDTVHLREQRLQRYADEQVLAKAEAEKRILLTFDLDFGELLALSGGQAPSVVLFRLRNARADRVWERLTQALGSAEEELAQGAVVVVDDQTIRIRRLPIGT
jgi:predicted nuclease of predicted toxin-antitoxin system